MKASVVRTKLLSMGLYGCETGPISDAALQQFRAAVIDCIVYTTTKRSTDLVFSIASYGTDVGPEVEVLHRRTMAARRATTRDETLEEMIKEIVHICRYKEEPGFYYYDQEDLAKQEPFTEPGADDRGKVKAQCDPKGPIGYLAQTLYLQAAALDEELVIGSARMAPIHLKQLPVQHIGELTRQMAALPQHSIGRGRLAIRERRPTRRASRGDRYRSFEGGAEKVK